MLAMRAKAPQAAKTRDTSWLLLATAVGRDGIEQGSYRARRFDSKQEALIPTGRHTMAVPGNGVITI